MSEQSEGAQARRLQRMGSFFEIAAALAVIISVAFLASELRQNTRSMQVGAYQDLMSQIGAMNTLLIEHPEFAELDRRVQGGGSPRSEAEQQQYLAWMRLHVRHGDMAYHQWERGLIDESRLRSAVGPVIALLRFPVGRDYWASRQDLSAGYRSFIDSVAAAESGS